MKKIVASLVLGLVLIVPVSVMGVSSVFAASPASHAATVAAVGCPNYSTCTVVPPSGIVSNKTICGVTLNGTAEPNSTIECSTVGLLVTLPCSSESGVSLTIHGTNLNLTVPGARIYMFNPATGQSTLVGAITGSGGEYTVVFGSCAVTTPVTLPRTGGGQPSSPGMPLLPLGLGVVLVLAGAAFTIRNRITQV